MCDSSGEGVPVSQQPVDGELPSVSISPEFQREIALKQAMGLPGWGGDTFYPTHLRIDYRDYILPNPTLAAQILAALTQARGFIYNYSNGGVIQGRLDLRMATLKMDQLRTEEEEAKEAKEREAAEQLKRETEEALDKAEPASPFDEEVPI